MLEPAQPEFTRVGGILTLVTSAFALATDAQAANGHCMSAPIWLQGGSKSVLLKDTAVLH